MGNYPVNITVAVRWSEMDAFGHVNNVIYYRYFEMARFAFYEEIDLFSLKESLGVGPIMARSGCEYIQPLSYPDSLTVGAGLRDIGTSSFTMEFEIQSRVKGVAARGETVLILYDYASETKVEIPPDIRGILQPYLIR